MSSIYLPRLVTQKYDATMDYHITMYDNLPYQRDSDFCGIQQVAMYSGHIIKYYLCLNQAEAFSINNRDDEIENILARVKKKEAERISKADAEIVNDSHSSGITQEQIQTLLNDPDESPSDNDDEYLQNTVNAFEGVEDW